MKKLLPWREHIEWCKAMPELARRIDDIEQDRMAIGCGEESAEWKRIPLDHCAETAEGLRHLSVVTPEGVVEAAEWVEALEHTLQEVCRERDKARREVVWLAATLGAVIIVVGSLLTWIWSRT